MCDLQNSDATKTPDIPPEMDMCDLSRGVVMF